ncbi:MAG: radical SAM protein [Actinomycetota bacterium]|nr:radical SAM protein [Actinomycetota bacterium]
MIEFAEITVGHDAGVGCVRCRPTHHMIGSCRPREDIVADIGSAVDGWSWGCGPNIVLLGCEAFSHPDLTEVVDSAVRAGVVRLSVRTDGAALADPDAAEHFVRTGVRRIEVTLLAGSSEVHDRLTGSPGSFDLAIAGMRAFAAASSSQDVKTTLSGLVPACEHNITGIPDTVLAFAQAGASVVTVDASRAKRRAHVPWLQAAALTGVLNAVWVSIEGIEPETLGEGAAHAVPATTCRGA